MKKSYLITAFFVIISGLVKGQFTVDLGVGAAFPITGYKTMVKTGSFGQVGIYKHWEKSKLNAGFNLGWGRLHADNNLNDKFQNVRIDQIPVVVFGEYELSRKKAIPYVGVGLGISMFNISYDTSPTTGNTEFNASFCIMPKVGLRLNVSPHFNPFIEYTVPFVMDGPPAGAGESGRATGFMGLLAGVAYRF